MVNLNNVGLRAKPQTEVCGAGTILSNTDMVSFLLGKSSMSPRHVEPLHNMVSRWSTQAQMCVCARETE